MSCLLAEFKLTAVLYRGRIEVTTAFWVAPLCTPPLNLSRSLSFLSHSVLFPSFSWGKFVLLFGFRWSVHSWTLKNFTGKDAQSDENIFFSSSKQIHNKEIHKVKGSTYC